LTQITDDPTRFTDRENKFTDENYEFTDRENKFTDPERKISKKISKSGHVRALEFNLQLTRRGDIMRLSAGGAIS